MQRPSLIGSGRRGPSLLDSIRLGLPPFYCPQRLVLGFWLSSSGPHQRNMKGEVILTVASPSGGGGGLGPIYDAYIESSPS
jgi:hypothetical protein